MGRSNRNSLLEITRQSEQMVVRLSGSMYNTRYRLLAGLSGTVLVLMSIYLLSSRTNPWMWWFVGIAFIVFLVLAIRAKEASDKAQEATFRIDKETNRVLRNGEPVATISDIDHILLRQVLDDDNVPTDYALVLSLQDTRRIPITEASCHDGAQKQLSDAAAQLAQYVGVEVKQGTRRTSEDWMDRS